jgi:hypothetical protein
VNVGSADSNRARLACHAPITNVDIVITCGQIHPSTGAQGDVAVAGGISKKSKRSIGRIPSACAIT